MSASAALPPLWKYGAVSLTLRSPAVLNAPRSNAEPLIENGAAVEGGPRPARPRSSAVGRTPDVVEALVAAVAVDRAAGLERGERGVRQQGVGVALGAVALALEPVEAALLLHDLARIRRLPLRDLDAREWVIPTLAQAEWERIQRVLLDGNGNVSKAARRLGILRAVAAAPAAQARGPE